MVITVVLLLICLFTGWLLWRTGFPWYLFVGFPLLLLLIGAGYIFRWPWVGVAHYTSPSHPEHMDFQRSKTLWDWLQLLIIPVLLAAGALWFNVQQSQISQQLAADQQQETTLKTTMDDIKDLLGYGNNSIPPNKGLIASKPGDEIRVVARAEVLSALRQLDGKRKGILIQFLYEAKLISVPSNHLVTSNGNDVIIDLGGANLHEADLGGADLRGVNLFYADLRGVHLRGADLSDADLHEADLSGALLNGANLKRANLSNVHLGRADLHDALLNGANLNSADLSGTNLSYADLSGADLHDALLNGANLNSADLSGADLHGALLNGANLNGVRLSRADLSGANLSYTSLNGVNLSGVNLSGADLSYTSLSNANLSGANLKGATGTTTEQLKKVRSLHGTIMPNGSKHP